MSSKYGKVLNITDYLFSKWEKDDQRIAIYYEGETWTYKRVVEEINKFGNALRELGIEKE
ncbi:hypothetical protein DJ522_01070 [Sulfolobus sp. F3]|nr:hypothetical protein DJ522_01070 [Sulfolobus sp. F3]